MTFRRAYSKDVAVCRSAIGTVDGRSSTTPHAATGAIWRRALVTATSVVSVESGVRHLVLRKKPGTVGYDRKQSRCGLPSQHALLQAWEKKDYMLTLVIHVLTIMLWAATAVAAGGIALGFLARTIMGRPAYGNHSPPVLAAIRWERNWHR